MHHGVFCQKDLGSCLIVFCKQLLIDHHQPGLADGGKCLLLGQAVRSCGIVEGLPAGCNGTGGYQHYFLALAF